MCTRNAGKANPMRRTAEHGCFVAPGPTSHLTGQVGVIFCPTASIGHGGPYRLAGRADSSTTTGRGFAFKPNGILPRLHLCTIILKWSQGRFGICGEKGHRYPWADQNIPGVSLPHSNMTTAPPSGPGPPTLALGPRATATRRARAIVAVASSCSGPELPPRFPRVPTGPSLPLDGKSSVRAPPTGRGCLWPQWPTLAKTRLNDDVGTTSLQRGRRELLFAIHQGTGFCFRISEDNRASGPACRGF